MIKPIRLVILDEDAEAAKRFAPSLSADGVVVYAAADPREVCQLISLLQHDILLIDIEKLIRTPIYPLQRFRLAKSDLKIVGISRSPLGENELLLELLGLDAYVCEPVTLEALAIALPEMAKLCLVESPKGMRSYTPDNRHGRRWYLDSIPFLGNWPSSPPRV